MSDSSTSKREFTDIVYKTARFAYTTVEEIFLGVGHNRVSPRYCYPGMILALLFYWRIDVWLFHKKLGFHYHFPPALRDFAIYLLIFSGWIIWGVTQAVLRSRLLNRLKDAFEAAKLKCMSRYPSLIEDIALDKQPRPYLL